MIDPPSWTVIIEGPSLPWLGRDEDIKSVERDCKQQTIKMLYQLSQLNVDKIHELIFFRVDMLLIVPRSKTFIACSSNGACDAVVPQFAGIKSEPIIVRAHGISLESEG